MKILSRAGGGWRGKRMMLNGPDSDELLPHEGVWARLGVSKIHGIGVFAQRFIPAGTDVFANDANKIRWVPSERLSLPKLDADHVSLYEDFAIRKSGSLGCPDNFNVLTVGWYLNEPSSGQETNTRMGAEYRIFTTRDVEPGEELTICYADFNA